MPLTSEWPLSDKGIRLVTPKFLDQYLAQHPLSQDLYPIAIGHYPDARQHRMRRDSHDSHLLIYCTAGCGLVATTDKTWRIKAGDLILLPKGMAHEYRSNQRIPWTIYWAHYEGKLATQYTQAITDRTVINIGLQPRLLADFEAIFSLRQSNFSSSEFIHAANQLKQMLTGMAVMARRHKVQKGQRIHLDRIRELMHLSIHSDLDLELLATEARLSKYHFTRKFKELTGHSPIQYFIHLKIQFACQLLDSTTLSVKEISHQVGYRDPYYFSRLFKQVIGISPSYYRNSLHG